MLSFATINLLHAGPGSSVYTERPNDSAAVYFIPGGTDGQVDVSDALQAAITEVKTLHNFGIIFIPQGTYLISKTIYIPRGVRLIGYGQERPMIVLARSAPGFQVPDSTDKGCARYMFWFTSSLPEPVAGRATHVPDAGASTFYSALSNVDLRIEDGNPCAVALRTHFAQHSFIAHVDIYIGQGKAGLFDGGNEIEDVGFFGGDYGIYTTKPSPGWPFLLVDTRFEGQRRAAVKTQEAGLTIVRMSAKHVPRVIDIDDNFHEKLFMEDCRLDDVSGSAILISTAGNASSEVNLRDIRCRRVPVLVAHRHDTHRVSAPAETYRVRRLTDGLCMDGPETDAVYNTVSALEPTPFDETVPSDIPVLPATDTWVNLRTLGAKGDGITDDTQVIQDAIDRYSTIYLPQGWYRVSRTIRLRAHTALIGLSPIGTQLLLTDHTPAFEGFGGPVPLLETPRGGVNIVTGIGLSTGTDNARAVACKWMSADGSYLNDVKFVGGHGGMDRPQLPPEYPHQGPETWDTQYWSLWVTNGGGGTFKDIWSASTYATAGVYISHTATPGRIYAMSVEHHVRSEVRFNQVSHWRVYALQLEEESRESSECQPMEVSDCNHMVFANLYLFRVIRVDKPYPWSVRLWGGSDLEFLNVHNYSQTPYTTTNSFFVVNTGAEIRPWELARLYFRGGAANPGGANAGSPRRAAGRRPALLARGFEFAHALCADSRGNIYFCESRMRRIYQWSAATHSLRLLADYPWEPLSLACDTKDNLLVVFKYVPRAGEVFTNPKDAAGTSFSGWGNSGFATWVYAIDPANPDETIRLLPETAMGTPAAALYPAHRWRDYHDFNIVTVARPDSCYVAPDGVTVIPKVYDLARATALTKAEPGKIVYVTDEYDKRTTQFSTDQTGYLTNPKPFAERGEFDHATDKNGNVYIADGEVYVYEKDRKQPKTIKVPERPTSVVISGNTLYITGHQALYSMADNY